MGLLGTQNHFTTTHDNEFTVEYGDELITAKYENAERTFSYSELGDAFIKLFRDEYNDIVHDRTVEDLKDTFPDISKETADKLINAFDSAVMADWKTNDIRASLKTPFEKKQLCTTSISSTSLGVRKHAFGRFPCSCHTYLLFL